ncbi:MAG: ABC transporter permease, partial [Candidatus Krumholzibacteria bacterium]|nr:ABC transporter permease [Candidatus Krumholzibacteria bacterium]
MSGLLWRSSLRYIGRHRVQAVLSVFGVSLGIAVVFSIDLVTGSSRSAFRLAVATVSGRATHHVAGGPNGLSDSTYTRLRVELGFRQCAPVVEGYVGMAQIPGRAFHLIGIDPFAEAPFRAYLGGSEFLGSPDLTTFLVKPGVVYLPQTLWSELSLRRGDSLQLRTGGGVVPVTVLGPFDTESQAGRGLDNIVVADIATAQDILGMPGRLSRIDLIVPAHNEEQTIARIGGVLPPGATIIRSQSRSQQIENMTLAFSRNLFALSLLALVVGMFLIYNTMTFSVVRRRTLIGDLRTLGVTRNEIFTLVLTEAALIGLIGTAAGLALGLALAHGLLGMVTRTINDLYFVLDVRHIAIAPVAVIKAVVLGMGATLLSASLPAREATHTVPRFVQHRSVLESSVRGLLPKLAAAGIVLIVAGTILLWLPVRELLWSYAGLPPLIAGFALLTPGVLMMSITRLPGVLQKAMGFLGRMAVRSILSQLSRSAVAIAALAIAVGTTVGVTTMVDSFRQSVVEWLERTLDADIYVSPPSVVSSRNDATLNAALVSDLMQLGGVSGVNVVRAILVETQHGLANLAALDMMPGSERRFRVIDGDAAAAWSDFYAGRAVLVSEPYAYRHEVVVGDSVVFATDSGRRALPVTGVYRDYASDIGTVVIDRGVYRSYWRDHTVSGLGLFLEHPDSLNATRQRINTLLRFEDEVVVRSNRDLRDASIAVFDRTFAITNVLRMLTVLVAFIGVLSALMALQLERARELGVLRALGLTPGQLWWLVNLQTGLMG